jgi:membrane protease YdiL (CAAX protease family)
LRLFLSFALALGLALVAAAAMAPAVQTLLAPIHVVPLHRIFGRLAMVALQGTTIWLLIRHGLATREVLGYAVPPRDFARQVLIGLIASIALMLLVLVPLFVLGIRAWDHRLPDDFPGRVVLGLKALQTGLVVALIEETFYRGAMQGSISLIGSTSSAGRRTYPMRR